MAKTVSEIVAWVADTFETPRDKVHLETTREEIGAWDSLGILTLMARMDEDFQVLPTEDEIAQMKSVRDILEVLRKHDRVAD